MSTQITWKVEEQPDVPDAQLVVVSHAAKERLVEQVPGHVLHHGGVAGEDALGVDHLGVHDKSRFISMFPNFTPLLAIRFSKKK